MRGRAKSINDKSKMAGVDKAKRKVTTVKQLKRKYNNLPLSFLFGIGQELEFQCPIIDEYIEKLESCRNHLAKAKRARTIESKNGHILKALYAINEMDVDLDNKTRDNFAELREYAKKWKSFAIRILDETKNPEKFVKH